MKHHQNSLTKTFVFLSFPRNAQTSSFKGSDSLGRLYEMDDHPDRRMFLDKLLSFMEEKGTPITQCPTISKNPLDLFRLYLFTKERGGYLEVVLPTFIRFVFECFTYVASLFFSAQSRKLGRTSPPNWESGLRQVAPTRSRSTTARTSCHSSAIMTEAGLILPRSLPRYVEKY